MSGSQVAGCPRRGRAGSIRIVAVVIAASAAIGPAPDAAFTNCVNLAIQ